MTTPEKPTPKRPRKKKKRKRKESNAAKQARRALREEKAGGRGVTREDRRAIYLRYGGACLKCGSTKRVELDHVTSLYAGGLHDPSNLQPLCHKCNFEKGWAGCEDYRKRPYNDGIHQALVTQIVEKKLREAYLQKVAKREQRRERQRKRRQEERKFWGT